MRDAKLSKTQRGFAHIAFKDRYGELCSIQKSSLATEDAIWFGQDEPTRHHTGSMHCRMHLTQDDVKWLLPILRHFAETGELPPVIEVGKT